ncbi:MAG: EamA family transporter [bacterium]|nr:EamA family transporter [bacterium]
MMQNKSLLGFFYGLGSIILWGSFYIVGRVLFGNHTVDPVFFTFLRFFLASLFLLIVLAVQGKLPEIKRALQQDFWLFFWLGAVGIMAEGVLVFASLKYTTAARSCLFANTSPVFTAIFAYFMAKEALGQRKVSGMAIGLMGMFLAVISQGKGDIFSGQSSYLGDLLALFSGICWAFYTVLSRRATSRYGGLVNGTAAIILGDAMLLLLTLFFKHPVRMDFSLSFWLYALYMGIFPSALAYVLWASALKHLEAGKLGSLGYASTLLTMTFSFLLLKERIDPIFIGGVLLVLGGIYFMLMERSPLITKNCRQERSIL